MTFANDLKREADQLRRRFVHHTRPNQPLSMDEARELSERMADEKERNAIHDALHGFDSFALGYYINPKT